MERSLETNTLKLWWILGGLETDKWRVTGKQTKSFLQQIGAPTLLTLSTLNLRMFGRQLQTHTKSLAIIFIQLVACQRSLKRGLPDSAVANNNNKKVPFQNGTFLVCQN